MRGNEGIKHRTGHEFHTDLERWLETRRSYDVCIKNSISNATLSAKKEKSHRKTFQTVEWDRNGWLGLMLENLMMIKDMRRTEGQTLRHKAWQYHKPVLVRTRRKAVQSDSCTRWRSLGCSAGTVCVRFKAHLRFHFVYRSEHKSLMTEVWFPGGRANKFSSKLRSTDILFAPPSLLSKVSVQTTRSPALKRTGREPDHPQPSSI
jgi:hypothetical protein